MPIQLNLNSAIIANSAGAGAVPDPVPPAGDDTLITEGGITITTEDGTVIVLES